MTAPQAQESSEEQPQEAVESNDQAVQDNSAEETTTESKDSDLPDLVRAKLDKVNREAQNFRNRLKEQEPLVEAAQEAERAKMSELERERADKAALAEQLARRDTEVLQARYNLTEEDLEFIGAGSFEERSARAEKFAARIQQSAPPAETRPPSERPVESLKPGASPSAPPVADHSYPASWGFQPPAAG
ncbi:hypothetical protein JTZ10_21675 [Gordonia rubripertincta]|uniref:Scaffolding protein n=1 Tax=Gordonia rubripertincta TaxID=36822 RepID=A0AAW4G9N0_GORRU|nr:hypothetical protein [Gordonia rubripertincta]MBM7280358.1 hypothetical protein [Gordonia rubripertincta]